MRKKQFLLLCFTLSFGFLQAQDTSFVKKTKTEKKELSKEDKKEYKKTKHRSVIRNLYLGYGLMKGSVRDEMTSPLLYKGGHHSFQSKYYHKTNRHLWQVSSSLLLGKMGNSFQRKDKNLQNPMTSTITTTRFDYWKPIQNVLPNEWLFLVGGAFKNTTWIRQNPEFTNTAVNIDFLNTGSISSRVEKNFNWKKSNRKLKFGYDLSLPIFSTIGRLPYNGLSESSTLQGIITENTKSGFFRILDINMNTELTYYLKNGNQLAATYAWSYYGFNPGYNRVKSAVKGLFISLIIKLDKNEEFTAF
jgi:hypothetical protein